MLRRKNLLRLVFLLVAIFFAAAGALGSVGLPLVPARPAATERRVDGEVNVLLGVEPHHQGWDVHHLLADPHVPVPDHDTSVVDRLGETKLEDLGLEPSLL